MSSKLNFEDTHSMLVEGRLFYPSSEIVKSQHPSTTVAAVAGGSEGKQVIVID